MATSTLVAGSTAGTLPRPAHGTGGHSPGSHPSGVHGAHHGRRADRRTLEFFSLSFTIAGTALPDLVFRFGPHLARTRRADFQIEVTPSGPTTGPGGGRQAEVCVRRPDGVTVLRRPMGAWTHLPPPLPPFAALGDRFAVRPATVVNKGPVTLALTGATPAVCAELGLTLAGLGWRLVSSHLLVLDRRSRRVRPLHTPLELRGSGAAAAARAVSSDGAVRTHHSPLTGESLLVRPEALATIAPLHAELPPPCVVRICRGDTDAPRMDGPTESDNAFWPAGAGDLGRALPGIRLLVPDMCAVDEVALEVDASITRAGRAEDRTCRNGTATLPAARAGSIA